MYIVYTFIHVLSDYLYRRLTRDEENFNQYTWRLVCERISPGQEWIFGIMLLKDRKTVDKIIGSYATIGGDITKVFMEWKDKQDTHPTWAQLTKLLKREQKMNSFCRSLRDTPDYGRYEFETI